MGLKNSYRFRCQLLRWLDNFRVPLSVAAKLCFWLFVCLAANLAPAASDQPPESKAARLAGDERRTRFVADISRGVEFKAYVIPEPYRVVIDLEQVTFRLPVGLGGKGLGLIRAYRYGDLNEGRSRIVMDARGPVLIDKAYLVSPAYGQPARIVVDIKATDSATFLAHYRSQSLREDVAEEAELLAAAATDEQISAPSVETEHAGGAELGVPSGGPLAAAIATTPPTSRRPSKTDSVHKRHPGPGRFKKPGVRTIVVDPGHGGIDPGAIGKSGTKEKDIVLAFARELKEHIERRPGYEVVLTRESDTFIRLRDRVRIARRNAADLFIVVHADAVRNKEVRGATVYTLSEKGSDAEAEELARNENKSDLIAGVDLGEESDEIAGILLDLAQREARNNASFFARSVVKELKEATHFTGKPLRSAGFRVLRAPDVPSVLLELGYLSHAADESQLRSVPWRQEMAGRLAETVDSYFKTSVASAP
jgi:N-acetylmuramoyl-L-alanine amidase